MNELLTEDRADGVRILTLNRPAKHNALNTALTRALLEALHSANHDGECRAIVLAGAGRSFCAGADTSEFSALAADDPQLALDRADLTTRLHAAFTAIDKPVVAAVQGNALGGGAGLALACDLMVAAENMRLGYPELRHGIVAAVVMANLVRQLGRKQAFALLATERTLQGTEAARLGLALEAVPAEQVVEAAVVVASGMAAWSPLAMATTKRLFYRVCDLPLAEALQAGRDTNMLMRSFRKAQPATH
ncbi:enoyl-CoA hydratase [Rhodoferax koreense]|uniref:Enoyl-CoA hydratase n=1 Tax=Rhodoferax koreensis TaxID=1842727 RepID=A0A1P8K151_9BURK|nr:enoyl-CoA hydratase/isomerase family protein [Rhodoferax koreense]APW39740.1 enoyl-CoA hydratase [Rhodoferax koreense]